MHASCPSCRTPILGRTLPDLCPACGEDLRSLVGAERERILSTPHLVLQSADGLSAEFPAETGASIGRHYENDVVVADREVSKRHALVELLGDQYVLRDLGSSNGTFVNGRRVDELRLRDGDEIRIGSSRLVFHVPDSSARRVKVVQSPSVTQVLASVRPAEADEAESFEPASEVADVETLRKDYERLRIAYRFHQEGGLVIDEASLYALILDLAFEWLPAENGVVMVPAEGGYREAEARSHGDATEIQLSQTLIDQVSRMGEGVLSSDAITDHRFSAAQSMVTRGVRSVLAVPVVTHGTIRAIVYLDSSQTASFTAKDLDILSSIASQAAVSLHNAELIEKIKQEESTRNQLERFLSPALVQQAARGELDLEKGGRLVRASVLFSDIRGFTALSESASAVEVVRLLNEYFEEMVDAVFQNQGILDKFIGDAVMAFWGVPVADERDAERAVEAAIDMQRRVYQFNARRAERDLPPIHIGVGVNTGECVVGNMGSSRRLEYTAIGDTVNLASRLCDLAAPFEIIVSEETAGALGDRVEVERLAPRQVKGKSQAVPIYRVVYEAG